MSRVLTMTDQFHHLLMDSDPYNSTISMSLLTSKKILLPEDAFKIVTYMHQKNEIELIEDIDSGEESSENEKSIKLNDSILNNESNRILDLENTDFYLDE